MVRARRLSGMLRKSLLSGEQSDAEANMPISSLTCTPSRTAMMGQNNTSYSTWGLSAARFYFEAEVESTYPLSSVSEVESCAPSMTHGALCIKDLDSSFRLTPGAAIGLKLTPSPTSTQTPCMQGRTTDLKYTHHKHTIRVARFMGCALACE